MSCARPWFHEGLPFELELLLKAIHPIPPLSRSALPVMCSGALTCSGPRYAQYSVVVALPPSASPWPSGGSVPLALTHAALKSYHQGAHAVQ